ncbi:hypothetical protein QFC19_006791 [Naganishia cerealis]|uniref:Uncharacterized protein n=1 Tax=Naganishia cerealis TaxID=610337 RepID=A0ACC2VFR8_9TREE|nr:hypothetical protein QFC19_006791 [Naganishia cerealis]
MSSITGTYASPSKINGVPSGLYLGPNGDVSHHHYSPPEHGSRSGHTAKDPFYRVDTLALKKQLLGAIGEERATEYWQSLAQFLKGKLRKEEFENLVQPILNSHAKRQLHNQLITAIMYNAASTLPIASTPTLPTDPSQMSTSQGMDGQTIMNPLKRSLDDRDSLDVLEPKSRIRQWVLSLPRSERKRIKALQNIEGRYGSKDWCEMSRGWQGRGRVRSTSTPSQNEILQQTGSPLCMSTRSVPPASALGSRIDNMANLYGLQDGVSEELGTFMSVALDYHLSDMITSAIELKRRRRAESVTVQAPAVSIGEQPEAEASDNLGRSSDNVSESLQLDLDGNKIETRESPHGDAGKLDASGSPSRANPSQSTNAPMLALETSLMNEHEMPSTAILNLSDLEDFFTVASHIHPHLGSATYRLRNGLARAVEEQENLAEQLTKTKPTEHNGEPEDSQSVPPSRPPSAAGVSPAVPPSSGTNSQSVTRATTPSSIHRKGAPTSLVLSNIPRIEVNLATPGKSGPVTTSVGQGSNSPAPNSPRLPVTGPGGIVVSRNSRSTLHNPTEIFRLEMEARGILKSMDRAAGVQSGTQGTHADGYDVSERQQHGHHWNYVDPAVILKDILG